MQLNHQILLRKGLSAGRKHTNACGLNQWLNLRTLDHVAKLITLSATHTPLTYLIPYPLHLTNHTPNTHHTPHMYTHMLNHTHITPYIKGHTPYKHTTHTHHIHMPHTCTYHTRTHTTLMHTHRTHAHTPHSCTSFPHYTTHVPFHTHTALHIYTCT